MDSPDSDYLFNSGSSSDFDDFSVEEGSDFESDPESSNSGSLDDFYPGHDLPYYPQAFPYEPEGNPSKFLDKMKQIKNIPANFLWDWWLSVRDSLLQEVRKTFQLTMEDRKLCWSRIDKKFGIVFDYIEFYMDRAYEDPQSLFEIKSCLQQQFKEILDEIEERQLVSKTALKTRKRQHQQLIKQVQSASIEAEPLSPSIKMMTTTASSRSNVMLEPEDVRKDVPLSLTDSVTARNNKNDFSARQSEEGEEKPDVNLPKLTSSSTVSAAASKVKKEGGRKKVSKK